MTELLDLMEDFKDFDLLNVSDLEGLAYLPKFPVKRQTGKLVDF